MLIEKSIKELHNRHRGEDIWIIASGSSMNYVSPDFFQEKWVICCNRTYQKFPADYVISHHADDDVLVEDIRQGAVNAVISEMLYCRSNPSSKWIKEGEYYTYKHVYQPELQLVLKYLDNPLGLVVGHTIIIDALSFAYHLGASNIILCGNDGATIDGHNNYLGYYKDPASGRQIYQSQRVRGMVEEFANVLRGKGVNVHSLNPFVNLKFEGHCVK